MPEALHFVSDLVSLLRLRAAQQGERTAYVFLADGESESVRLSYAALDQEVRALAGQIQRVAANGARALLLYPPGLEYIKAFFACLYAGVVAVPAHPPARRHPQRLAPIVRDAAPVLVLTTTDLEARLCAHTAGNGELEQLYCLATDASPSAAPADWTPRPIGPDHLAFLQYTSGSTGDPKGVMVTHGNLLANERAIQQRFGHTQDSIVVGWLPLYHDMGLIGNVLQPVYCGATAILMPPMAFLDSPIRWLRAIARYRAHTSGGPDFAYALCARKITGEQKRGLDLSTWRVAFNGAEPVRASTLERFAEAFSECGFRRTAFFPCYGLAEATLFVTGPSNGESVSVGRFDRTGLTEQRKAAPCSEATASVDLVSCGQSADEHRLSVVNPITLTLCSEGQVGEIWVAGPSVGEGYWNRPTASERTFRARLSDGSPEAFLRTGDLGFLDRAHLYITGRHKDLIILRGRNYHAEDLERALDESAQGIWPRSSVAFSVPGEDEERLVVVAEADRPYLKQHGPTDIFASIRRALADACDAPGAEIVLVRRGAVLKTSSGKVRRRACRQAYLDGALPALARTAPPESPAQTERRAVTAADERLEIGRALRRSSPSERASAIRRLVIHQIAQRLRIAESAVAPGLTIQATGLDSLRVLELKHELDAELGIEAPLAWFFSDASIAETAARLAQALSLRPEAAGAQRSGAGVQPGALSATQGSMWAVHQLEPGSVAYNLHLALRVHGSVDAETLRQALVHLLERHDMLRTVYPCGGEIVTPAVLARRELPPYFALVDAATWSSAELQRDMSSRASEPFDLQRGPVVRMSLYRQGERVHTLLLCAHHIAVDVWSVLLFLDELLSVYTLLGVDRSPDLPPPTGHYRDFIGCQQAYLKSAASAADWAYWRNRLAGELPVLALPADSPRSTTRRYHGGSHALQLQPGLSSKLKELGRKQGATLFMTLLAAYKVLLYRYTHQTDIIVGAPSSGRTDRRYARVVGNFVNPVAVRTYPSPELPFATYLQHVREAVLGALAHEQYPFSLLVERLQPKRHGDEWPIYQTMFVLQQAQSGIDPNLSQLALGEDGIAFSLGEWQVHSVAIHERVENFDLKLMAVECEQGMIFSFQYRRPLFRHETVARIAAHFDVLLRGIIANPNERLAQLPLLTEPERYRLIVEWNATQTEYPKDKCIHELFEAQVERSPQATAAVYEDQSLTYAELNAKANQLADHLRALGVGPDTLVGICVERSLEMIVGLLGILKAGGAYVPLDPTYPKERLAYMLEDARPAVLLTQARLRNSLPEHPMLLCLDSDWVSIGRRSKKNLANLVSPLNLAYVIYTSGSTGRPKGVGIAHGSLTNFLTGITRKLSLCSDDIVLAATSSSFDIAVLELLGPVIVGGQTLVASQEEAQDPTRLGARIGQSRATVIQATPSAWRGLLMSGWRADSSLRILCGGESLFTDLATQLLNGVADFWNLYGPTETTVWSTTKRIASAQDALSIGRPIGNTEIYLLDACFEPVPIGVSGELYIAGAGLARGYLNRPELTAERFIPSPFSAEPGERLYRTGDLARYRPDGNIEYLGRIDHQVKVRGFRIELGEIEARLLEQPQVEEAVVVAREDTPGEKRLVAYVVGSGDWPENETIEQLRTNLGEVLPDYMVPAAFVFLDSLPLTQTGKLERNALPVPDVTAQLASQYLAPRTQVEAVLTRIWADVLRLERVGVHDNFFTLGGDSVRSIQMVTRAHESGVQVTPRQVFQHPTVADLAQIAEAAIPVESLAIAPVRTVTSDRTYLTPADFPLASLSQQELNALPFEPRDIEDIYPLGPMQEGMLFHSLAQPGSGVYVMQDRYALRGMIDVQAFGDAWQAVVDHHPILRTSFFWRTELRPHQVVTRRVELPFEYLDWRGLESVEQEARIEAVLEAERRAGFDLHRAPLLRLRLVRLTGDRYRCIRSFHHILLDEWCTSPLLLDFRAVYGALVRRERPPVLTARPFRDYIAWLQRQDTDAAERFWRNYLRGFTEPTPLAVDRSDIGSGGEAGTVADAIDELSATDTAALRRLAKRERLTPNSFVQAAWALLLSRYSGRDEVLFGVTVAGRPAVLPGSESMLGLFVNSLPLRVRFKPEQRLIGWLRELLVASVEVREYEYAPLVEIQSWSEVPRGEPLFNHLLVFENIPVDPSLGEASDGLSMTYGGSRVHTNYPITVTVIPGSGLTFKITYSRDRFEAIAMRRMLGHFRRLLEEMIRRPAAQIGELEMLAEAERRQTVDGWNRTQRHYPPPADFVAIFEEQARRTPETCAVVCGGEALTYRALNARVNRVALGLIDRGVGPEVIVAMLDERGIEVLVAFLAILKAGGVYLPLDPRDPEARWRFVIETAQPRLVVAGAARADRVRRLVSPTRLTRVVTLADLARDRSDQNWARYTDPRCLAYIIFTSGSAGTPKGAMITRQGMFNNLMTKVPALGLAASDVVAQTAPPCFDISVWQFLTALLCGARVAILPDAIVQDPQALLGALSAHAITVIEVVPSLIRALLDRPHPDHELPELRWLLPTGEACPPELCRRWRERYPHVGLLNAFGPAECADDVAYHRITSQDASRSRVPIGRPVDNLQLYVLDKRLEPIPIGVPGELCVAGIGVGRGYLRRPDASAERFVPNPFGPPGSRLYRSGDIASYLADGILDFLGRADHQVKIRGHRVELGEVEAQLARHPAIGAIAVTIHEPTAGDRRLVAYYVARHEAEPPRAEALRATARSALPDYMIPSAFLAVEALPLNPNGKLDRKRLPVPTYGSEPKSAATARTPTEEILSGIWAKVLGIPRAGVDESFFALGGHSLLATQIVSRIATAFGIELPLAAVFDAPTVAQLAALVDAALGHRERLAAPPLTIAARDQLLPLSYAQRRLWFMSQVEPGNAFYHFPAAVRLVGNLDLEAVERGLHAIVQRHEVLRTIFIERDGEPGQAVLAEAGVTLACEDLTGHAPDRREPKLQRRIQAEIAQPFDLAAGPLVRMRLFVLERGSATKTPEHVLLLIFHHIVFDGWSFGVLARELGELYSAAVGQRCAELPSLPFQYGDYAEWQRRWLQGQVLDRGLAYWVDQLRDAPGFLAIAAGRPGDSAAQPPGAEHELAIEQGLSEALRELSRKQGVTLFMTLLAAFDVLLCYASGQEDLVVGTDVANRNRTETEGLIGFFINLLALRVRLAGDPPFNELLARVRNTTLAAYAHQDVPFDKVVEAIKPIRRVDCAPIFQVKLVVHNVPLAEVRLPGVELQAVPIRRQVAELDLVLHVYEEEALRCVFEYRSDRFDARAVRLFSEQYQHILWRAAGSPGVPVSVFVEELTALEQRNAEVETGRVNSLRTIRRKSIRVSP